MKKRQSEIDYYMNHKWSQKFCQPEPQPLATQKSLRGSKYDFVTSPLKQDPV